MEISTSLSPELPLRGSGGEPYPLLDKLTSFPLLSRRWSSRLLRELASSFPGGSILDLTAQQRHLARQGDWPEVWQREMAACGVGFGSFRYLVCPTVVPAKFSVVLCVVAY